MKLGPAHRNSTYGIMTGIWVTGIVAVALRWFVRGDAGVAVPWSPTVMKLHGAAAMAFLILLGSLQGHMTRAWELGKNRVSGVFLLGICAFFAVTGWVLYYSGTEWLRESVSVAHWAIGIAFPAPLIGHIVLGRARARVRIKTAATADPAPGLVMPTRDRRHPMPVTGRVGEVSG